MFDSPRWKLIAPLAFLLSALPLLAQEAEPKKGSDLGEFKTVDTAVKTTIKKGGTAQVSSPAYLGVLVAVEGGKLIVGDVEENSPAAKAGLQAGDLVTKLDGKAVKNAEVFRSLLQTKSAGESVKLTIKPQGRDQGVDRRLDRHEPRPAGKQTRDHGHPDRRREGRSRRTPSRASPPACPPRKPASKRAMSSSRSTVRS